MPKGQLSIAALMGRSTEAPVPANGSLPEAAVCRDSARAEVAGVSTSPPVGSARGLRNDLASTTALAAGYRQRERSPSIIDQSEAHLSMVREIQENYRVSALSRPSVQGVLHDILRSVPPAERQLLNAELGDLQGALRRLLQSVFTQSSPPRHAVNYPVVSPGSPEPDTKLSLEPAEEQVTEEEDGSLVARPVRRRSLIGRISEFGGAWFNECARLIRNIPRFMGNIFRSAKEGMQRMSRKAGNSCADGMLPAPPITLVAGASAPQTQTKEPLPQWTQRFGDDPRERLKETVNNVTKVLEEIARARHEEKERENLTQEQIEEQERSKLNRLRDLLASLLVPMDDGVVPLSLLSRHFIGPWRTDDDLRAAIARARQAKYRGDLH